MGFYAYKHNLCLGEACTHQITVIKLSMRNSEFYDARTFSEVYYMRVYIIRLEADAEAVGSSLTSALGLGVI